MAGNSKIKLADDAKVRFGTLSLVFGTLCMGIGVLCFVSDAEIIASLDLGPDAGVIGWYLMSLGMLLAIVGLVLGATIQNRKSSGSDGD